MKNKTYKAADPGDIVTIEGEIGNPSVGTVGSNITNSFASLLPGIVTWSGYGRCRVALEMGMIVEVDEKDVNLAQP